MSEEIKNNEELTEVVGIRFKDSGKVYYFAPNGVKATTQDYAIVETARGVEFGKVCQGNKMVSSDEIVAPLRPVLRIATEKDIKAHEDNKKKEAEALKICQQKVIEHGLEMKLIEAEYTFDCAKLTFYFTADGRIDFRELVKDLAAVFKTRIELRQVGVRDETKIVGGIGICGRPLCCNTYLQDFIPVSIKMAKEQNLSLNPTKISGTCGRLMCCLKNEQDTYEYLNSRLPNVGDTVFAKDGNKGEVQSVSVLRQLVKVIIDNGDEKELREYKVDELNFRPKKRKDVKITEEELKELEGLEDELEQDNSSDEETGENQNHKKRYDGKGKRHFGKNKKRNNNSSEK